MALNMKLVSKGRFEPTTGLIDQLDYHLGLSSTHAAALAAVGWSAADHSALATVRGALDAARQSQLEARDKSWQHTRAEHEAVQASKEFRYLLSLALKDIYIRASVDTTLAVPVTEDAFLTRELGNLGRNTSKLIRYFGNIRQHVVNMKALLDPYFNNQDVVAQFDAVRTALEAAQATQELALEQLPQETLAFYEQKGAAVIGIERLNRLGKMAFAKQATTAGHFNKDVLLRARRQAKKAQAEQVTA